MAENKFMNLLSDIDEKYIKDMTEEKAGGKEEDDPYQEAEIVIVEKKKSGISLARIFSYAAAALLITAAVGFGARLVKDKLPVDPANTQETENTENTEFSGTGTVTLPEYLDEQSGYTVGINDVESIDYNYIMDEKDISDYPRINTDFLPNVDDCFERLTTGYGGENNKIIVKGILDTKKCGEFRLSLLGYGLFTDNKMFKDKLIALWGYRIVLEVNGNVISSQNLDSNLFVDYVDYNNDNEIDILPLYPLCMLNKKDSMADITSVDDFVEHQIVTVRAVGDGVVARSMFYGVKNNALYQCLRADQNYSQTFEYLSGICSASTGEYQNRYTVIDEFSKKKYEFDFLPQDEIVSYYVWETEFETDISEYAYWKDSAIFDLSDGEFAGGSFAAKTSQVMAQSQPNIMFDGVGADYNVVLYLVGHYPRVEAGNDEGLICSSLKVLVYQDGVYLGSIPVGKEVDSMVHLDNYKDLMPQAFTMDNIILIVANNLNGSYYGVDCFYAIKDGKFYSNIDGEWSNATGNLPEWTKDVKEDKSSYGEHKNGIYSVLCGFYKYEFDFDNLETGGLVYHVSWLDEEDYYWK